MNYIEDYNIIGNSRGMRNVYCIVYYTYIYFIIYI